MFNRAGFTSLVVFAALLLANQVRGDDAENVVDGFTVWASKYGSNVLQVRMGWSKSLSYKLSRAIGHAQIELATGKVKVQAIGLDQGTTYEVWLVDNRPAAQGHSVRPEKGDALLKAGTLAYGEDGVASLSASLGKHAFREFDVDLVVICESGENLEQRGLLYGSPTLYQRAYVTQLKQRISKPELDKSLKRLVAEGERLFREETFMGNGRTCATCHPASNNFTIDPAYISGLRPDDPLFVAEYVPALSANFEKPKLMRKYGLILENTNGFGDLANGFTMRSVPHTLAQPTSLEPAPFDGSTQPPFQRTGWSGDGAPGGGTLREFAIGAVTQHFTKSLNRQSGVDFRLPTDNELDAMEAYQLSLGRQKELDLDKLRLRSPVAQAGLAVFQTTGKCFNCHKNAGANAAPAGAQNANFNTGVEALGHPAILPSDDGFGNPGNGSFNTPPLVEAADTAPYFHNNSVAGLEDSVAFYRTDAFKNSPSGIFLGGIAMTDIEVKQVGAFLRVINALENIRSATNYLLRAQTYRAEGRHVRECVAEIEDAIEVLNGCSLHPKAVQDLQQARQILVQSSRPSALQFSKVLVLLVQANFDIRR